MAKNVLIIPLPDNIPPSSLDVECGKTKGQRVETGAIQFGSDWPGLFIRGDNCAALAMHIKQLEEALKEVPLDFFGKMALVNLRSIKETIFRDVFVGNAAQELGE